MTDRELMEFAGKAYGFKCWRSKHGYLNMTRPDGTTFTTCYWPAFDAHTGEKNAEPTLADGLQEGGWTPLHDDGDALRLAYALKIDIEWQNVGAFPEPHVEAYRRVDEGPTYCASEHENDYRRAIVRAAAEIGKAMK